MKTSKTPKTTKTTKTTKIIEDKVIIFTDGSCKGSLQKRRCGYGVYFPDGKTSNISKPFTKKLAPYTNQRAELYAIYAGIKKVIKKYTFNKLIIKTDSMYCINCLTKWIDTWKKNGWIKDKNKLVKNKDILIKIDKYITKYKNYIIFEHVKAHNGIYGNEKADELACNGANKCIYTIEDLK
jgi:ribonuclease HI